MKRTLLQRGAIIAACAAAFVLGGCGDTEFDSRTDTVYSLETPQVTAKAYPGVNIVSWKPVTGAKSYVVTVYEEGVYVRKISFLTGNSCFDDDKDLMNGKTYTYSVEAQSATNPGTVKEAYALNSRGEKSVKAIVPPAGTKALALPAYENGYDGTEKTVGQDDLIINETNITVKEMNGNISVTFPMKAYLSYNVACYDTDYPNLPLSIISPVLNDDDSAANNDVTGHVSFPGLGAGTYRVMITVTPRNTAYEREEVIAKETADIKKLKLNNDVAYSTPAVKYLYNDGKIADDEVVTGANKVVRISFTPATKTNGETVPAGWYKVYRRVKGEYTNTQVSGTVKKSDIIPVYDGITTDTYYIDDEVTDFTKIYQYTIIATDGTSYTKAIDAPSLVLKRPNDKTIDVISIVHSGNDRTKKETTWTITPSGNADSAAVKLTAYYWVKPDDWNGSSLVDDIIADNKTVSLTGVTDSIEFTAKTAVEGEVYLLVKAVREGYTTAYYYGHANVNF